MADDNITSNLSCELLGPESTGDSGEGNWLIITQAKIPEQYEIAIEEDLDAGIAQLESGHSSHTAVSSCPVKYSSAPGTPGGQRKSSYMLTFYVHRSVDVEQDMELTLNGEILDFTGPRQGYLPRQGKSWDIDNNKTQQLGWRAAENTFVGRWEIAFGRTGARITNPTLLPEIINIDGFVYLIGDPVKGTLNAQGTAVVDIYTAKIEHDVGTKWTGNLYATAWWPKGIERKYQQSFSAEMLLPGCVQSKFEDCADELQDIIDDGGDPEQILNQNPTVKVFIDDCDGTYLGKDVE